VLGYVRKKGLGKVERQEDWRRGLEKGRQWKVEVRGARSREALIADWAFQVEDSG
jgi:hypothetical protein